MTLNLYFGVFFDSNVFLEFKSNSKKRSNYLKQITAFYTSSHSLCTTCAFFVVVYLKN